MKLNVVGVDIAKRVFQVHWVEKDSGERVSVQLKREKFLEHFVNRAPCLIGMEACGGSQHWARELVKLGHEVKLLSARWVKPFVGGNKNDVADARGISTAVQQPGIKVVAITSEAQQAVLALHRMRQQLGEVAHRADQWPARIAHRIRRSDARGQSWHSQTAARRLGTFGAALARTADRQSARAICAH